jgi:hypothetical protein
MPFKMPRSKFFLEGAGVIYPGLVSDDDLGNEDEFRQGLEVRNAAQQQSRTTFALRTGLAKEIPTRWRKPCPSGTTKSTSSPPAPVRTGSERARSQEAVVTAVVVTDIDGGRWLARTPAEH